MEVDRSTCYQQQLMRYRTVIGKHQVECRGHFRTHGARACHNITYALTKSDLKRDNRTIFVTKKQSDPTLAIILIVTNPLYYLKDHYIKVLRVLF